MYISEMEILGYDSFVFENKKMWEENIMCERKRVKSKDQKMPKSNA